jgi:hypothetical protein
MDTPDTLNPSDKAMARAAQRMIMTALDHSRAATITLTTDSGESPVVEVPPAALRCAGPGRGGAALGLAASTCRRWRRCGWQWRHR